jgi:Flp pilus assembly pilin Flp
VLGFKFFNAGRQWASAATLRTSRSGEAGATAVEYSLLAALIATVIIAVVQVLGGQLVPGFQSVIDGL